MYTVTVPAIMALQTRFDPAQRFSLVQNRIETPRQLARTLWRSVFQRQRLDREV